MRTRFRNRACVAVVLTLLAGLPGCKPERPVGRIDEAPVQAKPEKTRDWVVASIGDRDITFGELQDVLDSLPVFARMRYQSLERRRDFLEAYVQYVILALAAESEGYGKDPVVLERLKGDLVDRFLQERVDLKVKTTDIPEEAVQAWFEGHPFEFKAPARKHVAQVVLKDRATADTIGFRIRKTIESLDQNHREEFGRFAARYSADPATKDKGGDLGLFPRLGDEPAGAPEVVVEAVATLSGLFEVSAPIEAPDGFHVLFISGMVSAIDETLDQARPRIVERLMAESRDRLRASLVADLSRRVAVRVNPDVAAAVAAEVQAEAAKPGALGSEAAPAAGGGVR